ncbi:hypothetical protein Acr_11g0009320 [Actinidia rufa]|uniref:Uncharacterized protein n=1 Tax=Actinidia rufa TaxID=165716 RepID=A0A7J0FDX7_9ERIC|nr:hypothetical protein Acr_11g0009320 [Actinidia rufa]
MTTKVTQYPSSPREDPSDNEGNPLVDNEGSSSIRLPKVDETIASTCPSEVAFYEAALQAGLRLPITPQLGGFGRICLAFSTIQSQTLDGFVPRRGRRKPLLGGIPAMSNDERINFSSSQETTRSSPVDNPWEPGVSMAPTLWSTPCKRCNVLLVLTEVEQEEIRPDFCLNSGKMASSGRDNDKENPWMTLLTLRLTREVVELKEREALAKTSAVEEYKFYDDFQDAMEWATSKYFGKSFDFMQKKQIMRLHPKLNIQNL